jgi:NO-binding membrane sensor protein with MHYT domain
MVALEVHYNTSHIFLTLGMAFIGSFSAVSLCEQYRLASLSLTKKKRHLVLMLVALALGWGGTWSTHVVGMSSIKLYNEDVNVPVRYNAAIVVLAAIQAVIQIYMGMVMASTDECFNKSRTEIIELFVARTSSSYTLEEIKKLSKWRIFFIVCTHSLARLTFGGFLAGSSVAVMFYTMLQSLEFAGTIEYNAGVVVASFLFAIFNGIGSFWTFFRLLSLFPSLDLLRSVTALLGINAISGMFYIGMAALTFHDNSDTLKVEPPKSSATIRPGNLYTGGICSCVIVVCVMLMFVLHDLRSWLLRTSTQLRQADKVIAVLSRKLRGATKNQSTPLELVHYARVYQCADSSKDASATPTGSSPTVSTAGAGRAHGRSGKYHALYNDYDEEEAIESETGSNPNDSIHGDLYGTLHVTPVANCEQSVEYVAEEKGQLHRQSPPPGRQPIEMPISQPGTATIEEPVLSASQKMRSYEPGSRSASAKIFPTAAADSEV